MKEHGEISDIIIKPVLQLFILKILGYLPRLLKHCECLPVLFVAGRIDLSKTVPGEQSEIGKVVVAFLSRCEIVRTLKLQENLKMLSLPI